jgi:pyruvate formate lyase activating enzyme
VWKTYQIRTTRYDVPIAGHMDDSRRQGDGPVTNARIGGTIDLSTIDLYGSITSMVFFAGCNFRCPYCQNANLVPMNSGREMDTRDILERIRKNTDVIDAVGFTGGEPCLQAEALEELASKARVIDVEVFLNTNGSNPTVVENLIKKRLIDHVALDIKAPLRPESYRKIIGTSPSEEKVVSDVKATLRTCLEGKVALEVRTTIVPGLIDREEDVKDIAREIPGTQCYVLQQFSPQGDLLDQSFKNVTPPSREKLIGLAKAAIRYGICEVKIRTRDRGEERISP